MSPIKRKIIIEYLKLVRNLQVGYPTKYDHILDMISFVEIGDTTKNPILIQNHFLNL